jgi:hypothetical protein
LIAFIKKIIGKLSGKFNLNVFNNFGNKTIINYPEVDKDKLRDTLLTSFSDKISYKREEIADKINKLL